MGRTEDAAVDWFILTAGAFVPLAPESDGTLRSPTFPGLWLNPVHLFANDLAAMFKLVEKGVGTSDHTDFVKRIAEAV